MTNYPPAPPPQRTPIPDDWPANDTTPQGGADDKGAATSGLSRWPDFRAQAGIGAAIGIGSAALVAALLYARKGSSGTEDPAPKADGRRRARTTAKS